MKRTSILLLLRTVAFSCCIIRLHGIPIGSTLSGNHLHTKLVLGTISGWSTNRRRWCGESMPPHVRVNNWLVGPF
jgi:hypothetical protein